VLLLRRPRTPPLAHEPVNRAMQAVSGYEGKGWAQMHFERQHIRVGCFWRAVCECLRESESLRIVTAGSHAVLELCRVAVSAYGSPLCMALHAMGNTDGGKDITAASVSVRTLACAPGLRFLPHA